jgi:uncharacterized protein (DUF433 family)
MTVDWKKHIASDPEILRGKPRLKGTRIPVGVVLGYLAAGKNAEEIIAEVPDLTREHNAACLDYARELSTVCVNGQLRPCFDSRSFPKAAKGRGVARNGIHRKEIRHRSAPARIGYDLESPETPAPTGWGSLEGI